MFVTRSRFTADAVTYAEGHGIVLVDGDRLAKLVAGDGSLAALADRV
jgi:restriction endonuclease Mrr